MLFLKARRALAPEDAPGEFRVQKVLFACLQNSWDRGLLQCGSVFFVLLLTVVPQDLIDSLVLGHPNAINLSKQSNLCSKEFVLRGVFTCHHLLDAISESIESGS